MKSKFFGLNAKLALALLAVCGTMFTGCYESEKEDVAFPSTPLPVPVYTIAGTVTDVISGKGVPSATLTFTPASGTAVTATTDEAGGFSVNKDVTDGTYNVTIAKANYETSVGRTLTVTKLERGQAATYMFNAGLSNTELLPEEVKVSQTTQENDPSPSNFDASEVPAVDVVNRSSNFMPVSFNVRVNTGGKFVEDQLGVGPTRAAIDELKTYVRNYLTSIYGTLPVSKDADFATKVLTYEFQLAPKSSLKSVKATTFYKEDSYVFNYGDNSYSIKVLHAYKAEFDSDQFSNEIYEGTGHGHGHGEELNAGGGIVEPII